MFVRCEKSAKQSFKVFESENYDTIAVIIIYYLFINNFTIFHCKILLNCNRYAL